MPPRPFSVSILSFLLPNATPHTHTLEDIPLQPSAQCPSENVVLQNTLDQTISIRGGLYSRTLMVTLSALGEVCGYQPMLTEEWILYEVTGMCEASWTLPDIWAVEMSWFLL